MILSELLLLELYVLRKIHSWIHICITSSDRRTLSLAMANKTAQFGISWFLVDLWKNELLSVNWNFNQSLETIAPKCHHTMTHRRAAILAQLNCMHMFSVWAAEFYGTSDEGWVFFTRQRSSTRCWICADLFRIHRIRSLNLNVLCKPSVLHKYLQKHRSQHQMLQPATGLKITQARAAQKFVDIIQMSSPPFSEMKVGTLLMARSRLYRSQIFFSLK